MSDAGRPRSSSLRDLSRVQKRLLGVAVLLGAAARLWLASDRAYYGDEAGTALLIDESYRYLTWNGSADVEKGVCYAVARDVTRSKELEGQRSHGQKELARTNMLLESIRHVHGLAGSAAVMLLLLPKISSFWVGIGFLLLFGVGTILSMGIVTLGLGVPFAISGNFERMNRAVARVAGTASMLFGAALMSDIAFDTSLIPF